ncbi:MAG: hypothetical protein ACRDRL_14385 [Sciscionella sp.]
MSPRQQPRAPAELAARVLPALEDAGVVSIWCSRIGAEPVLARRADQRHYAASLVKLAVLLAAYRGADRADLTAQGYDEKQIADLIDDPEEYQGYGVFVVPPTAQAA